MTYTHADINLYLYEKIIGKARYSRRSQSKARIIDRRWCRQILLAMSKHCILSLNFYSTYCITELFNTYTAWIKSQARNRINDTQHDYIFFTFMEKAKRFERNQWEFLFTETIIVGYWKNFVRDLSWDTRSNIIIRMVQINNRDYFMYLFFLFSIEYIDRQFIIRCVRFDSYCMKMSANHCNAVQSLIIIEIQRGQCAFRSIVVLRFESSQRSRNRIDRKTLSLIVYNAIYN